MKKRPRNLLRTRRGSSAGRKPKPLRFEQLEGRRVLCGPIECPADFVSKPQTIDPLQWWEDKTGNGLTLDDTLHPGYSWKLSPKPFNPETREVGDPVSQVVIPNGGESWTEGLCWTLTEESSRVVFLDGFRTTRFWGCNPTVGVEIRVPEGRWISTDSDINDQDQVSFNQPSIAGLVFEDKNGNGLQDTNEVGEPFVRVELGGDEALCPSTYCGHSDDFDYTDEAGKFLIVDVGPRADFEFPLSVPATSEYLQTTTSPQILPRSGESIVDQKIGIFKYGSASGRVFNDRNGNGELDSDETVRVGTPVFLDKNGDRIRNPGEPSTSSDAEGKYRLTGLGPGVIYAAPGTPTALFSITTTTGLPYATESGADLTLADLGVFQNVSVYGQVFHDKNGDGVRDHYLDLFLPDVTVQLDLDNNGTVDRTATTNSFGYYEFRYVGSGTHRVRPVLNEDQEQTMPATPNGYLVPTSSAQAIDPLLFGIADILPLVVNSSESRDDRLPGDEQCDTGVRVNGVAECTLWAAIQEANAQPGRQRILFDPKITVIHVATPLPEITDPVRIDGGEGQVILLGNTSGSGLKISAGNSAINGLVLAGFDGIGLELTTNGRNVIENCEIIGSDDEGILIRDGSNENTIRNNRIGLNSDGADRGNERSGIRVLSNKNVIGGVLPEHGNVIAFNSQGILVEGGYTRIENNVIIANREEGIYLSDGNNTVRANHIGIERDDAERGNGKAGILSESEHNLVGGVTPGDGNVIAYNLRGIDLTLADENTIDNNEILLNAEHGIALREGSDRNVVRRNFIGIDRHGFKFSNGTSGIWIASSENLIGGVGAGEGNTIAHNGNSVDSVGSNTVPGNGIVVAVFPDATSQRGESITGNAILGNSVYLNGGPAIDLGHDGATANDLGTREVPPDLDDGPNQLQNAPEVLTSFDGQERFVRLRSTPNQRFRIEIFASPAGDVELRNEGRTYLTSFHVTTDAQGLTAFKLPALEIASDDPIMATATRFDGDGKPGSTSEFSSYPTRNIDDCTNTELQKTKDGLWKSILQRIDAVTADDYAAWQRLRQLALNHIRPQADGCILATEAALRRLDELVTTQTQAQGELGWWEDFWDIMADDYDRVEGLIGTAWESAWDAVVEAYDEAPTLDEIWSDVTLLTDPEFRNDLLQGMQETTSQSIQQIQSTIGNAMAYLAEHGNELLWDAVVSTLDKASNTETYTNLVADLLAFEALSKAFDPNVPVEQRVANWLFGYMQVVGTFEGAASLAKGLNAARAQAFTKELASEITDDPNAQRALINRIAEQKDAALKRSEASVFGKTQPGIYRLKDGDVIDEDLLWTTGYTKRQADAISAIAKGRYILKFRPTNMDSARWISRGSLPKPVTIKAKTISEIDVYLGYRAEDLGLVGLKDPKDLLDPAKLDACKNPLSNFCEQLKDRYRKHQRDYANLTKDLGDAYVVDENGVVKHLESQRTVAGDIDPIEFFHADGSRVVGDEYQRVLAELKEASIQHGGEVYYVQDMIEGMAQTCRDTPHLCKEPGSEEWKAVVEKASEFTAGQRVKYRSREEVAVEFGVDGLLRRRDIEELPDLITGGEGEDSVTPTNHMREEFKYFLEQTDIDIRRDRLTTVSSFFAALQQRSDSQAALVTKFLRRVEVEASITVSTFEEMTGGDFVKLIESEPKGLRIDLFASGGVAEGEDAATLTADRILAKIQSAVGDSGMSNYRVVTQASGGYVVHSRTAQESPYDVNGDRRATPLDALIVINRLNDSGATQLALWPSLAELRTDVNLDGFRTPFDVLVIINFLNEASVAPAAEGEIAGDSVGLAATIPLAEQSLGDGLLATNPRKRVTPGDSAAFLTAAAPMADPDIVGAVPVATRSTTVRGKAQGLFDELEDIIDSRSTRTPRPSSPAAAG